MTTFIKELLWVNKFYKIYPRGVNYSGGMESMDDLSLIFAILKKKEKRLLNLDYHSLICKHALQHLLKSCGLSVYVNFE